MDLTSESGPLLYGRGSRGCSYLNRDLRQRQIEQIVSFFKVQKNLIFERAKFNMRNQNNGKTVEQYVMALYHLVQTCEYGDFENEL